MGLPICIDGRPDGQIGVEVREKVLYVAVDRKIKESILERKVAVPLIGKVLKEIKEVGRIMGGEQEEVSGGISQSIVVRKAEIRLPAGEKG